MNNRRYITSSPLLSGETRELFEQEDTLDVCGVPLNVWYAPDRTNPTGRLITERHFDPKNYAEVRMVGLTAMVATIERLGGSTLDDRFVGTYVTLSGFDVESGDEYRFGVRSELGFIARAVCQQSAPSISPVESMPRGAGQMLFGAGV